MKIEHINIQNFMAFNSLDITFSPQINIIFGENSTGKSALLKVMYVTMGHYRRGSRRYNYLEQRIYKGEYEKC